MKEIGGYFELDNYRLPMLHQEAIALNSGRNCLAYLIEKKKIKKIYLPKFLCASVGGICRKNSVEVVYYSIGLDFLPKNLFPTYEWVYLVNYYGQLSNDILRKMKGRYPNLVIDNVQAYFQKPIEGVDTIYTCRKFFGVADGAFLYSNVSMDSELKRNVSCDRVAHILGRYEMSASEYYSTYTKAEAEFEQMPVMRMSKLTNNLLHAIDYELVRIQRNENFEYLHKKLGLINKLELQMPDGPYMYPLYLDNGAVLRRKMQQKKIYISTLWTDVFDLCDDTELEYDLANNILPLPVDQRYGRGEMDIIIKSII